MFLRVALVVATGAIRVGLVREVGLLRVAVGSLPTLLAGAFIHAIWQ
jgi:hypothetical protein